MCRHILRDLVVLLWRDTMEHEKQSKVDSAHIEHAKEDVESSDDGAGKVVWDARSIIALLSLCLLWVGECFYLSFSIGIMGLTCSRLATASLLPRRNSQLRGSRYRRSSFDCFVVDASLQHSSFGQCRTLLGVSWRYIRTTKHYSYWSWSYHHRHRYHRNSTLFRTSDCRYGFGWSWSWHWRVDGFVWSRRTCARQEERDVCGFGCGMFGSDDSIRVVLAAVLESD